MLDDELHVEQDVAENDVSPAEDAKRDVGARDDADFSEPARAKAIARMLRVSPQKLNLVAQLIRRKKVSVALADLQFSRKRIAVEVKKTLESAIANAENNHGLDVDDLVVSEAYVGKAMVMRRFHARARGRSSRIEKTFSNLTIVLEERVH